MDGFSFLPGGPGDIAEFIPPSYGNVLSPAQNAPPFSELGGGPIYGNVFSPPVAVPVSQNRYGGQAMPAFLSSNRGGILGSVIGAIGGALGGLPSIPLPPLFRVNDPVYNSDICGADTVYDPITGSCKLPVGVIGPYDNETPGTSLACRKPTGLMRKPAQCYVRTAKGRRLRGRYVMTSQGLTCCPAPRRMNPANAHALSRAARRLRGFAKLERRIHKALNKAMGSQGRRMARSYKPKCGTCRKTKCVC